MDVVERRKYKMKIYLAGCRGKWREIIKSHFDPKDSTIEFLEPFGNKKQAIVDYVKEDLEYVEQSDIIFMLLSYHVYTGACVEAGYAYALGKPVILVFAQKGYIDPLLLAVSRKVFTDLDSAIDWFKDYIKRMN